MKKELLISSTIIAGLIVLLVALAALFSSGCQGVDDIDNFELEATTTTTESPKYWVIVERAKINSFKVDTADYLPDPWATLSRAGDQMGKTASCDMETYDPVWEDHVYASSVAQLVADEWTISLWDYELEPSGNAWLGSCVVDASPGEIEHTLTIYLEECQGAVESITIRFELFDDEIDTDLEMNPNC